MQTKKALPRFFVVLLATALNTYLPIQYAVAECGDFDGSGTLTVSDVVAMSQYLFAGGPPPIDFDQADFDLHDQLTFNDVAYLWACSPVCDFPASYCPPTEAPHDPAATIQTRILYQEMFPVNTSHFGIEIKSKGNYETQALCLPLRIRVGGIVPQIDSIVTAAGSSYRDDSGNVPIRFNGVVDAESGVVVISGAKWDSGVNLTDPLATVYVTVPPEPVYRKTVMEYVDLTPEQSEAGEENSIFAMILPPQYFANFNDPLEPELVAYYCLVPGDANGNGAVTISDAIYIINIIFFGFDPVWPGEPDADASGGLSIGDAVYLINYIFGGGPAPTCYL